MIGLAGGIGAGKSEVAAILGGLRCVVIDSDAEARAALERPEVRAELVSWWGPRVLGADGHVDRTAVAGSCSPTRCSGGVLRGWSTCWCGRAGQT